MVPASLRNCADFIRHQNTTSNNKSGFGKSGVHVSLMRQELQVANQGGLGLHSHQRPRHLCPSSPAPCAWLSVSRPPRGSNCCQSPSHHTSVQEAEKKQRKGQGVLFPGESATFKEPSKAPSSTFTHISFARPLLFGRTQLQGISGNGVQRGYLARPGW